MYPIHCPVTEELKYVGTYAGVVVDNEDPEGRHRIRARLPGYVETTAWAFPRTMGGGSAQQGGHMVPAVGADVVVEFLDGNIDKPMYSGGSWNAKEMPTTAKDAGTDAHKVAVLELGRFMLTIDTRDASPGFSIVDKVSGDGVILDAKQLALTVRASSLLLLKADAQLVLEAAEIMINGRKVLPTSKGI